MIHRVVIFLEKEKIIEEFLRLEGIDEEIALKLVNAGIKSISDLELQDAFALSKKIGHPQKIIDKWIETAKDIKRNQEFMKSEEKIHELKDFLEIPYEQAKILRNVGVFGIEDLANEDPLQLSDDSGIPLYHIERWIKKAIKELARSKKALKDKET